jgi:xanthine dehydrogenase molybdenum-binding subunit
METVIAQIVAEEMGVMTKDINVISNDTDVCPWDVGVHASRSTFVAGNAAFMAARKAKNKILEIAARYEEKWRDKDGNKHTLKLDENPENLVIENSMVYSVNEPDKKIALGKILRGVHFTRHGTIVMSECFFDPDTENFDREFKGNLSMTYAYGTHGVEVEVDKETGKVKILKYIAAHDVGRAINPMLLEGQVYGAAVMGAGYALTEQLILEKGEVMNPNFRDYKLLTAKDTIPIEPVIIETNDEAGPYGAKGIGEPGCVPSAPAIANAIYDAVGVRIRDLPITPEKVLKALKQKKEEK